MGVPAQDAAWVHVTNLPEEGILSLLKATTRDFGLCSMATGK